MTFLERLGRIFASKDSLTRQALVFQQTGKAVMTPANYEAFATQGYSKNSVVYTCIHKIALACGGVQWVCYSKRGKNLVELEVHPLKELFENPNPVYGQASFIEEIVGFKQISGNAYIEASVVGGKILELWPVRPDRMTVIPNSRGYVQQYKFKNGAIERLFDVDQVDFKSPICHWKSFHPVNTFYGLSPLEAALLQLDQNNAGQRWNLALLQNSASPSGVLQLGETTGNPRAALTDEQYKRLRNQVDEWQSGPRNAGRPMILEGGLKWQQISLSPKEMDFLKSKEVTATDIAMVYGVPAELLGLGQKTFNNYREAKLSFYEETVLPELDSFKDMFNMWAQKYFGPDVCMDYDKDQIEALALRREQKFTSLAAVKFLTINEKREAVGYESREDGDVLDDGSASGAVTDDADEDLQDGDKPPKDDEKPEPTEDESEESVEDEDEDDEKGFKAINLLNKNEKNKSWRRQNRLRKRLAEAFRKDLKSDYKDLSKKLEKIADDMKGADVKLIEFALLKTTTEAQPDFEKTISRHLKYTLEEFGYGLFNNAKSLGLGYEKKANLKFEQFIDAYIQQYTGSQIKTIFSTNEKTIRRIVKEWTHETITAGDSLPELSKYLSAEFEDLSDGRARTIARTEVARASNNGSLEAMKVLQIPGIYKEWITAGDDRVRDGDKGGADHTAMAGVEVPLNEKFTVPPDASMEGPGDVSGEADQVINCRCVLVYKQRGNE